MFERNIFVSNETIIWKARKIIHGFNCNDTHQGQANLILTDSYLCKFRKQKGFQRYYCFGESTDLKVKT